MGKMVVVFFFSPLIYGLVLRFSSTGFILTLGGKSSYYNCFVSVSVIRPFRIILIPSITHEGKWYRFIIFVITFWTP